MNENQSSLVIEIKRYDSPETYRFYQYEVDDSTNPTMPGAEVSVSSAARALRMDPNEPIYSEVARMQIEAAAATSTRDFLTAHGYRPMAIQQTPYALWMHTIHRICPIEWQQSLLDDASANIDDKIVVWVKGSPWGVEPTVTTQPEPKKSRKKLYLIGGLVGCVLAAVGIGVGVAAASGGESNGPTEIQQAVAKCHAPKFWVADGGHSLIVHFDDDTPSNYPARFRCIWWKMHAPASVINRTFDAASMGSYQTKTHSSGQWPGYRITVNGSVLSSGFDLGIVITEES